MPVIKKKPITWTCMSCNANNIRFTLTGEDKQKLIEEGFQHQLTTHELVEENREYFMNGHWGNYYDIS